MNELFEVADAYLSELDKMRTEHKRRAVLKSAKDAAREKADAKRRRPLRDTQPWL